MPKQPSIQVEASPVFNRNLRDLAKKYRNIRDDIKPIVEQLEQGELLGNQIPGIGYAVFKLRVRNSDAQKGKSAGLPSDLLSQNSNRNHFADCLHKI